jgi:hypothetical protein
LSITSAFELNDAVLNLSDDDITEHGSVFTVLNTIPNSIADMQHLLKTGCCAIVKYSDFFMVLVG